MGLSSSSGLVLAKVSANGQQISKSYIVNFEAIPYNESMIYKNGIFLILDPGYYEVKINFYSIVNTVFDADLLVNNKHGYVYGRRNSKGSLNMSTIVKLNKYDSVFVRIKNGITSKWGDANNFSIRKIN